MPRSRSRSPRAAAGKRGGGGFRWKDKPKQDSVKDDDGERDVARKSAYGVSGDRERGRDGYRDRDESKRYGGTRRHGDDDRDRGRRRDDRLDDGEGRNPPTRLSGEGRHVEGAGDAQDAPQQRADSKGQPVQTPIKPSPTAPSVQTSIDDDIAAKFGAAAASKFSSSSKPSNSSSKPTNDTTSTTIPTSAPKPAAARAPTGPMIVVKVNDRLGTTTKVPCLGSDTVGDFKKLVAMRIGRRPHEIMLKRQSERPFKDFLTLDDYGVGDGVQLDLEIDTGD